MPAKYESPNKYYRNMGIDRSLYQKAKEIKDKYKFRSVAQVINLLAELGLKNRKVISHHQQAGLEHYLLALFQVINALDAKYAGACNNLNQIAYKINLISLDSNEYLKVRNEMKKKHINLVSKYSEQCTKNTEKLKKIKEKDIDLIKGEINKIWQQLEYI